MDELPQVPLADDVWPKFLRHNALRVLGLADSDDETDQDTIAR
jgi:hypothetical protein